MALQTTQRRDESLGRPGMPYDSGTLDTVTRTAEVDGFARAGWRSVAPIRRTPGLVSNA